LPFRSTERVFTTAYSFRRYLQRELAPHLDRLPTPDPTAATQLPVIGEPLSALAPGFRPTPLAVLEDPAALAELPIDHSIGAVAMRGGAGAARARLNHFVADLLPGYGEQRNHPDAERTSQLSAYLHFGHISPHEVFATLAAEEMWTPVNLAEEARGARQGWWGMSGGSEAYLDQLVTWRELGLNMCHHRDDYDHYSSLPDWALETLDAHRGDERPHLYSFEQFEAAGTHDEIWNAAQTQLVTEGRIHNYLRMLWGKKILEWSPSPEDALTTMIDLNNRYALDGRDPNSYSGIFWVLGRYDRPWGPERPVLGKVRYMTSASTARKLRLADYLRRYAPAATQRQGAATC
jgi:deoxyribodipyrimidine photo-lyase